MAVRTHLRLGDILVKEGLLKDEQLKEALNLQKTTGKRLGEALIMLKMVTEEQMAEVLGRQIGIPYRRFDKGELKQDSDPLLRDILPIETVRKEMVLPLSKTASGSRSPWWTRWT